MNRRKWITCLIILMTMMLMALPAAAESTNKAEIRRVEDLKGKVIAVQDGTISDQLLEANEVLRGSFTVHHYTSTADMVEAVKAGKSYQEAFESNVKTYGRYNEGVKFIDPRKN